jgi:hypothetical protein
MKQGNTEDFAGAGNSQHRESRNLFFRLTQRRNLKRGTESGKKLEKVLTRSINSNTNDGGGESRGPISRNCEKDRDASACAHFVQLCLCTLSGQGLPFQRIGGERAGFAQRRP